VNRDTLVLHERLQLPVQFLNRRLDVVVPVHRAQGWTATLGFFDSGLVRLARRLPSVYEARILPVQKKRGSADFRRRGFQPRSSPPNVFVIKGFAPLLRIFASAEAERFTLDARPTLLTPACVQRFLLPSDNTFAFR
jgi:hypothetical protein